MDLARIVLEKTWLFILSASVLIWTSGILAQNFSRKAFDRFWIFLSTAYLQISAISLLLSLFKTLAPVPFLVCQIILVLGLFIWRSQNQFSIWPFKFLRLPAWGLLGAGFFLLIILILGSSLLSRILTPIQWGDVLYYHASRPLYWIQHRSVGPYPTVNDRQISFAFGSDLIFMYTVLFTREEIIGRLFFWLGTPLAAFALYTVMRQMGQNRVWSLFGVVTFLTIPLVYIYAGTLEPLIWLCLFGLGTGYWTLRLTGSESPQGLVFYQLGVYAVLSANMKNSGLSLLGGVFLVGVIFLLVRKLSGKYRIRNGSVFLISLMITSLLSGLGALFAKNLALYGSLTGSQLRSQENLAVLSPYQLYVHIIRLGAVLLEFPVPFFSKAVDEFGQGVVNLLGADHMLPREDTWSWVGHYQYQSRELYQAKSFGVLGLLLAAGAWGLGRKIKEKVSSRTIRKAGLGILKSPVFSYGFVSLSLVFGPALLLRWIDSGTRSFLAPGLVCLLPLAVFGLSSFNLRRLVPGLISLLVMVFVVAFTGTALHRVIWDLKNTAPHWEHIIYSRRKEHISSDRYIPLDATVILLGYPNTKDYYFFGEDYSRKVIQWPESFDQSSLDYIHLNISNVYLYVDPKRCSLSFNTYVRQMTTYNHPNFEYMWGICAPSAVLNQNPLFSEVHWPHDGRLFHGP